MYCMRRSSVYGGSRQKFHIKFSPDILTTCQNTAIMGVLTECQNKCDRVAEEIKNI